LKQQVTNGNDESGASGNFTAQLSTAGNDKNTIDILRVKTIEDKPNWLNTTIIM